MLRGILDLKRSFSKGWRSTLLVLFFLGLFLLLSLPGPPTVGSSGADSLSDSATALQQCVIVCPDNINHPPDPYYCWAAVNYAPTVGGPCSWMCAPQSGSSFYVGTTTVVCYAIDQGTGQIVARCGFTVTMRDTEPPIINGQIRGLNDPGQCGRTIDYEPGFFTYENCGAFFPLQGPILCSPPPGSFFPVGISTITCTATDGSGNTGTGTITVTVEDHELPTITCPGNMTVPNDPGECEGATVGLAATAEDNCPVTVSYSPPEGSFFPVGTTTVTATATDASGHSCMCNFDVTVNPLWPAQSSSFHPKAAGVSSSLETAEQGAAGPALLVADFVNDQMKVLLSNGNGTFRLGPSVPVGHGATAIAVSDFNHDGNTDAVTANVLSEDVSVLLGIGDGSFTNLGTIHVGSRPSAVTVGDFTSDGQLDLVVANSGDDNLSLLKGRGDGTFAEQRRVSAGAGPIGLVAGDFNQDNRLDLAVSNFGSNTVTVLLGNGDGTFTRSADIPVGAGPIGITTGDFDGDGRLDIATANFTSNSVSILKNKDGRSFTETKRLSVWGGPVALVAGEFLSGHPGIALTNIASGEIVILLRDQTGTLSIAQRYAVTGAPMSITTGDFNNDERLDLSILNRDGTTRETLLNNGNGTFRLIR